MRVIFLILMLTFGMNTYAQNTPSSPQPPQAGTTPSGITYAKSETATALAISLQFNASFKSPILAIINSQISGFNGSLKIEDNSYYYEKIELQATGLKLEIKTNGSAVTEEFANERNSLLSIYNDILKL